MTKTTYGNGIGKVLYKIRKEKGISKVQLSNSTHLDIVYIDMIERNKKKISLITLKKYTMALHIPIDAFAQYKIQEEHVSD